MRDFLTQTHEIPRPANAFHSRIAYHGPAMFAPGLHCRARIVSSPGYGQPSKVYALDWRRRIATDLGAGKTSATTCMATTQEKLKRKMNEPIHIISLGAGVQSSTMALMAAKGEITPMPVAAVFADTGDEPESVYKWIEVLRPLLPFPIRTACRIKHTLSEHIFDAIDRNKRVSKPPLFTKPANSGESEGLLTRDCTGDFKVAVIQREARKIMAECGVKKCVQWIGISLDETIRIKPSRVKYSQHRWPLVELRQSRHDCLRWMDKNGFPTPPRSACVYCPHHSNEEWRRLRDNDSDGWQKAISFDAKIRTGIHGVKAQCFVHRDCIPLGDVDLSRDDERGQGLLWGNECEGMCGV